MKRSNKEKTNKAFVQSPTDDANDGARKTSLDLGFLHIQ
jgi:hypothetical protein